MSTAVATKRLPAFTTMTELEQARHLVEDHGFDRDYFEALGVQSNDDVVVAFLAERFTDATAGGESYPHPNGRASWHENDHADGDSIPVPHTHSTTPTVGTFSLYISRADAERRVVAALVGVRGVLRVRLIDSGPTGATATTGNIRTSFEVTFDAALRPDTIIDSLALRGVTTAGYEYALKVRGQ